MKKSILSMVLAVAMVMTMLTGVAFAAEPVVAVECANEAAVVTAFGGDTKASYDAETDTITLKDDVVLTDSTNNKKVVIKCDLTINLNNKKISGLRPLEIVGAAVTIKNGTIAETNGEYGLRVFDKANVTVENVKIVGFEYGIFVGGGATNENRATLTIKGEDTLISGSDYAVAGNGRISPEPLFNYTTINIEGGKISNSDGIAIYHPQIGTLNVSGGVISGATGI